MGISEREEKGTEEIFKTTIMNKFPSINVRYQITDPVISEHQTG